MPLLITIEERPHDLVTISVSPDSSGFHFSGRVTIERGKDGMWSVNSQKLLMLENWSAYKRFAAQIPDAKP